MKKPRFRKRQEQYIRDVVLAGHNVSAPRLEIVARSTGEWLNLYTIVCNAPEEAGIRARLLEVAMRLNLQMLVAKFVLRHTSLVFELDYQVQHLDVEVIRSLVSLIYSNAEDQYAKLFRIVSGDDVLKALDRKALSLAS